MTDRPWVLRILEEPFHRDAEDRPLREGRTPPELLRDGEIEYRACPYDGGRAGRPMNVSALRQTTAHWDEIAGALALLRAEYGTGRTLADVWRLSQVGSALPWFYVMRGGPLPAYAAALSKATLGTAILANRALVKTFTDGWQAPPLTPASLAALAEETGTLVGAHEVCSAPSPLIEKLCAALLDGVPPAAHPLAGRADDALGFGACYAGMKHWLWLYFLARRFLYADLSRAAGVDVAPLMNLRTEPPDCFVVEPPELADTPLATRRAWFAQLAAIYDPFAPTGDDDFVRVACDDLAATMGNASPPLVESVGGKPRVARAVAQWVRLDSLHADVLEAVERGLRRAAAGPTEATPAFDAAARDRTLGGDVAGLFAAAAPGLHSLRRS
ncbi:MAG TPA: hypothetical protein VGM88_19795 [Kofleriaceae bacterium]|jgi:hypothetical protein